MNIFEFKNTKLGMTLVEMIISLVVLSILMTSTMGIIISSSNIFVSTSKATIDKRVGNAVFDLLENIIKYTTHLEISDTVNAGMAQNFSIGEQVETDVGVGGKLYYQSEKCFSENNGVKSPAPLYDSSFYGDRSLQYELTPIDTKHVEITVRVIRENRYVYQRSSVIRCVNLALIGGANGNSIVKKSSAPTLNPVISFSVNEELISGGSTAWSIENRVSGYIAKYNKIVKDYYTAFSEANKSLNNYYAQHGNEVVKTSILKKYIDSRNVAVFGGSTGTAGVDPVYNKNITEHFSNTSATATLPSGAKYDSSKAYTEWNNIRAVFQQKMFDLLHFMPDSVTSTADPYYGILASREELFAGFLLEYYSADNNHVKVNKDSWPTFDNPSEFFSNTSLEDYATGQGAFDDDFMAILGYFKDNINNAFYTDGNEDYTQFARPTSVHMTASDTGYTDAYTGKSNIANQSSITWKVGKESTTTNSTKGSVPNGANYVNTQSNINFVIKGPKSNGSSTGATKCDNDSAWVVGGQGTGYTYGGSVVRYVVRNLLKWDYSYTSYYDYSVSKDGSKITASLPTTAINVCDLKYTNKTGTVYELSDSITDLVADNYRNVAEYTSLPAEGVYDMGSDTTLSSSTNLKYIGASDPIKDSWSSTATALISANYLGAKNIENYADRTRVEATVTGSTKTYSVYKFVPKASLEGDGITEGWYYYYENESGAERSAYHFFYLQAMTGSADYSTGDDGNNDGKYIVNEDKIAVAKANAEENIPAGEIYLFSGNYDFDYFIYQQAQYKASAAATKSKKTKNVDFIIFQAKTESSSALYHEYNDWFLYGVDWNSWFESSAETKGILNKIITAAGELVDNIRVFFGGDSKISSISNITQSNPTDSLGARVQFKVGSTGDTRSFKMAWIVYNANTGTWYYLPASSTRVSGILAGSTISSVEDDPTAIDLSAYAGSSSLYADIANRQRSKDALGGLVNATEDCNWVSLPMTADATETTNSTLTP